MENNFNDMINDKNHWHGRNPPLCPNPYEIECYKYNIKNKSPVCLLGMTKELLPLCDYAIDLNPVECDKPVRKMNWWDILEFSEVMIGDGVLNLVGLEFVDKVARLMTNSLVCRVFLKKQPWMKYATHFPTSFPGATWFESQPDIAMVRWKFI